MDNLTKMSLSEKLKVLVNKILNKFFNSQPTELPKPTAAKSDESPVSPKVTTVSRKEPFSICLHCLVGGVVRGLVARVSRTLEELGFAEHDPNDLLPIEPIRIVPGMNLKTIQKHIIKMEQLRGRFEQAKKSHMAGTPWLKIRITKLDQDIEELRQTYEREQRDSLERERERRIRWELMSQSWTRRWKSSIELIENVVRRALSVFPTGSSKSSK